MQSWSDHLLFCAAITGVLVACMLAYRAIAIRCNIIDKPNQRSSHHTPVVRGAGVVFPIAFLLGEAYNGFQHPYMLAGLLIISIISFADDVREQRPGVRLPLHAFAVLLLFGEVQFFEQNWWLMVVAFIIVIGSINAFNFMDGINGITGVYALVNITTFLAIAIALFPFTTTELLMAMGASIVVFLFFNFRKKALCFAGDVGSVSLAFIQIFFLMALITFTNSFSWVLIFTVFGVDASITILYRIIRKENIFVAHRSHLYQYLANEKKIDHRVIALIYAGVQSAINIIVYKVNDVSDVILIPLVLIPEICAYLIIRTQVTNSIQKATTKTA